MDGHFVPNISFGIPVVEAVRRVSHVPLDVHLMIANPANYIEAFRKAGADSMTIHAEVVDDPRPLLERIRTLGASAGLAINPPTPINPASGFAGSARNNRSMLFVSRKLLASMAL
jgi:ribulose-phosphate 3-epimerase